jgi:leucine-rich repeat protein SHOC2
LNLSDNELESIESICSRDDNNYACLEGLVALDARNNRILQIPNLISLLSNLAILNLSGNGISTLPAELFQCPLVELYLSSNKLTTVPKDIANLAGKLSILDLGGNEISDISSIPSLKRLTTLVIARNRLVSLGYSNDWENMNSLTSLDASKNMV